MPKCSHDELHVIVSIMYEVQAEVGYAEARAVTERPVQLRVTAACLQCSYNSVFTAYPNRADGFGWSRWPKWLLRRMGVLSRESTAVHQALETLEFRQLKIT